MKVGARHASPVVNSCFPARTVVLTCDIVPGDGTIWQSNSHSGASTKFLSCTRYVVDEPEQASFYRNYNPSRAVDRPNEEDQ